MTTIDAAAKDGPGGPGQPDASGDDGCNLLGASSCPSGQGCYGYCRGGVLARVCNPAGTGKAGDACELPTDCGAGLSCYEASCASGLVGMCKASCASDADCGANSRCQRISCGETDSAICTVPCDPRPGATQTCPAGRACKLLSSEVTDCACVSGTVDDGGTCNNNDVCKAGFICTTEQANKVCRPMCRLDQPATCAAGRTCTAVPGLRTYGSCSPSAAAGHRRQGLRHHPGGGLCRSIGLPLELCRSGPRESDVFPRRHQESPGDLRFRCGLRGRLEMYNPALPRR